MADENTSPVKLRDALVEKLMHGGNIRTALVEEAFRTVPRHCFVPGVPLDEVYRDEAIITKRQNGVGISSSSQPTIMAIMLEQLGLERGQRILEIGAGTGYNAALLAEIVGDGGEVVTVDLDEDTAAAARAHLGAAGYGRAKVVCADGGHGYADAAPYDRIILSVGAWDILPAWIEQLKPQGRIVLPLSIRYVQDAIAFDRRSDHLESVSVVGCGFMELRGAFAAPRNEIELGPERGLSLVTDCYDQIDADAIYASLTGRYVDHSTGLNVTAASLWEGLLLWLCLREPSICSLSAVGEGARRGLVPYLFAHAGHAWTRTYGLQREETLCTLLRAPAVAGPTQDADSNPFELFVRRFGSDESLSQRLIDHCRAWDAAGRPGKSGLRIRAYPADVTDAPPSSTFVLTQRSTRLVIDWQQTA